MFFFLFFCQLTKYVLFNMKLSLISTDKRPFNRIIDLLNFNKFAKTNKLCEGFYFVTVLNMFAIFL